MQTSVTITLNAKELVRILNAMLEVDNECEGGLSDGQRETYNSLYGHAKELGCSFVNGWWITPRPAQVNNQQPRMLASTDR